jgi:hypothetical protein
MERCGDTEMGRQKDNETRRWSDNKQMMGRWGDKEQGNKGKEWNDGILEYWS